MRSTSHNEIEYLGDIDGLASEDRQLVREMCQRLDALRRFDQNVSASDWRPHHRSPGWRPESPIKAY